ncbi:MAG: hypothetical protein GY861_18000 [bacterium]|nr:hypothetical protein [bacterium]
MNREDTLRKIKKPDWHMLLLNSFHTNTSGALDHWFKEHVEPLNAAINDAVSVTGYLNGGGNFIINGHRDDSYRALLLDVRAIKKEEPEDILKDIVGRKYDGEPFRDIFLELKERSQAVLGEE